MLRTVCIAVCRQMITQVVDFISPTVRQNALMGSREAMSTFFRRIQFYFLDFAGLRW